MARDRILVFTLAILAAGTACHPVSSDDAERRRISDHLERVAKELSEAPTDHLDPAGRTARAETLAWLDEYRAHGVYPHNHLVPDRRVPVFVDAHGTPCAVGYLLLRSGRTELVEEIVRTDNLVRVPELAGDARLSAWLAERGITLEEAAAIQPAYTPPGGPPPLPTESNYAEVTLGMTAVSVAASLYTFLTPREDRSPWVGLVNVASLLGHSAMVAEGTSGAVERPDWAVGVNSTAAVVSVFAAAKLISDRVNDASRSAEEARFEPTLNHGPNGLGLGFTLRH